MFEVFDNNITLYLSVVFVTIILKLTVILTKNKHGFLSLDTALGPQKIHEDEIPRIGGLVIFLILIIEYLIFPYSKIFQIILISSIPTFISGLYDDLFKNTSYIKRLVSAFISGTIFIVLTHSWIKSVDVFWVDYFLDIKFIAISLSILSIATLVNAFNIIDGLNGLSIGTALFILIAIYIISIVNLDHNIAQISLNLFLILIVSFAFNFPNAKIFIGDCGAYLLGFFISTILILMPERNQDFNSFSSLLLILYPFYELMKTIFRRLKNKNTKTWMPDNMHLHSLLYQYNVKYKNFSVINANPLSTLQLLCLPCFCCIWTVLFYDNLFLLLFGGFILILTYEILYNFLQFKLKNY